MLRPLPNHGTLRLPNDDDDNDDDDDDDDDHDVGPAHMNNRKSA